MRPDSSEDQYEKREVYGRPSMDPVHSFGSGVPPDDQSKFDPYARTESMTHRGRYSYASSAVSTINSPRRVRRRKDPTPFKYVNPNLGDAR